jgi:hypothetical protein
MTAKYIQNDFVVLRFFNLSTCTLYETRMRHYLATPYKNYNKEDVK